MKTIVLGPTQDWRRLGYVLHGSSSEYRRIIRDNPEWSMDYLPPLGTPLVVRENGTSGTLNSGIPQTIGTPPKTTESLFPFSSEELYIERLSKYSPDALLAVEGLNGYTLDSIQALTGMQ